MQQRFEYRVIISDDKNLGKDHQKVLDDHAKEGWRLLHTISDPKYSNDLTFIFERPHPDYKQYNDEVVNYLMDKS